MSLKERDISRSDSETRPKLTGVTGIEVHEHQKRQNDEQEKVHNWKSSSRKRLNVLKH